ncbi:MAG: type II toxin-antitoxin system RelE/ParE family toxin [Chloroflexi bacterium]|nr:type II toxin-antitoxin system RelE/ParE family toxin [Chloroflexota bacterium]
MASYSILFKSSVQKDLRALPKAAVPRILRQIERLQQDPIPRRSVKLTGAENLYRIRVGDYRVLYAVDRDARQVVVYYVRHRREAYRDV